MAKMNVTVDNGLEDVKLVGSEIMTKKGNKKEDKRKEKKKDTKNKREGYLKQVALEMKYVTWPTRKNLIKYSIATIVMIILLSIFFIALSAFFDLLYALVQGWIG